MIKLGQDSPGIPQTFYSIHYLPPHTRHKQPSKFNHRNGLNPSNLVYILQASISRSQKKFTRYETPNIQNKGEDDKQNRTGGSTGYKFGVERVIMVLRTSFVAVKCGDNKIAPSGIFNNRSVNMSVVCVHSPDKTGLNDINLRPFTSFSYIMFA